MDDELKGIERRDGEQHARMMQDLKKPHHAERPKPQQHDGTEDRSHLACADPLDTEQADDHRNGHRDDKFLRRRKAHLHTFNRGKD